MLIVNYSAIFMPITTFVKEVYRRVKMNNALIKYVIFVTLFMSMSVFAQYDGSSSINRKKAEAQSQIRGENNLTCRQIKKSYVDILANGSSYTYDYSGSVMSAAVLKSSLEEELIRSLSFFPIGGQLKTLDFR